MSWWWPFQKKQTLAESGILRGMTDYHSHLLPGVDDGVQTFEESLEILRLYEQLGIREVWFTPHIMEDIPNTTAGLRSRFEQFQKRYTGNIRLHLAAEYMLDNLFKERLAHRDLLPIGEEGNHLLVETSYFNPPMDLYGMMEKIKSAGFIPVLAHPERYTYMGEKDYHRLKEAGVVFQSNLPSVTGSYGKQVLQNIRHLLVQKYTNIWGTDIHRLQILNSIVASPCLIKEIFIKNVI
ncbi:tyrosine-protein phosphatase [Phocaeicola sp.]|uniref:tyrosine-protein phosphatase n=1 Tax=Phocaeicola sp. TaxID=2773926 RepID=UPI003AB5EF8B